MKIFKNKKGFTLIELIIVVSLLAILAVIAIPIVGDIMTRGNVSVDTANIALYESALESFVATPTTAVPQGGGGAYPATAANAVTAISRFSKVTLTGGGLLPAPADGDPTTCFLYNTTSHRITKGLAATAVAPIVIISAQR